MPKTEIFDKDQALEKASNVFHAKGYNATSMQDLVDATGLNRSSIYNSFGNKHSLFLECLKLYQNQNNKATTKAMFKANTALEALEALFGMLLKEIVNDRQNKGCLIANCKSEMANQDKAINSFLKTNQDHSLALFSGLIAQGQEAGDINTKQSAEDYALYLYTALQGFRLTGILTNNKQRLERLIAAILQNLI